MNNKIIFPDTAAKFGRRGVESKPLATVDNLILVIEKYELLQKIDKYLSIDHYALNQLQLIAFLKYDLKQFCKTEGLNVSAVELLPLAILKMRGVSLIDEVAK